MVNIGSSLHHVQGGPKTWATTNFSKNRIKDCQRD